VIDGNVINHMSRSLIKFLQSSLVPTRSATTVVASPIDIFAQQSGRINSDYYETVIFRVTGQGYTDRLSREPQGAVAIL